MSKAENRFSPETEAVFKDWVQKNGIEAILFDFDGTLIDTSKIFINQTGAFFDFAANSLPAFDEEVFEKRFRELEDIAFDLIGISPRHWHYILDELAKEHGDAIKEGGAIFEKIYTSAPDIFDGVKEILDLCKKVGLKIGLVTHASKEWTDIKLTHHNLSVYFEHVVTLDPETHKHKGTEHWQQAIQLFGVNPEHIMVVGDSLSSDINAAHRAGVKKLVWVQSDWHRSNTGDVPSGVYKVKGIESLIETLIGVESDL